LIIRRLDEAIVLPDLERYEDRADDDRDGAEKRDIAGE